MGADEYGRRAATPGGDRVIDLAAFEEAASPQTDPAPSTEPAPPSDPARPWTDPARTWTIDLTDLEASTRPRDDVRGTPRGRPRRGVLLGTIVVVALLLVTALAAVSYRRANAWREIALEQRARGEALEQRLEAAGQAVGDAERAVEVALAARDAAVAAQEAAAGQLGASEQDVAALEARIAQLASEKARLEDDAAVGRQQHADSAVAAALVGCVADVRTWLGAAPRGEETSVWDAWSREGDALTAACDTALAAARR